MDEGMRRLYIYRDAWQNELLWWMCKAIRLLLDRELRG